MNQNVGFVDADRRGAWRVYELTGVVAIFIPVVLSVAMRMQIRRHV